MKRDVQARVCRNSRAYLRGSTDIEVETVTAVEPRGGNWLPIQSKSSNLQNLFEGGAVRLSDSGQVRGRFNSVGRKG